MTNSIGEQAAEKFKAKTGLIRNENDWDSLVKVIDATIKEREAARWSLPEIAGVVPTSWLDSLLSGPGAVIGKPPFDCKDIEFLLDGIRKRILNFEIPTPVPLPSEEKWMSIAYWPAGTCGNDDVSSDIHDTHEAAEAVCRLLERKGFGGDGLVFPTHTEVSSVQGSVAASTDDTKRLKEAIILLQDVRSFLSPTAWPATFARISKFLDAA